MTDTLVSLLSAYIPRDRRQAMAERRSLPIHQNGAALFADISGFTPLTENLRQAFGPRLGAEKLASQLNQVYDALVAEIDRFGGSVIGFSGDAITCWFCDVTRAPSDAVQGENHPTAAWRAVSAAFALHDALSQTSMMEIPNQDRPSLSVKVAIASGSVKRYLLGDPSIQMMDVAGGETLTRMANAESLASRGEVVIDACTVEWLSRVIPGMFEVGEKRLSPKDKREYSVLRSIQTAAAPQPWPELPAKALGEDALIPWLLPAVYDRLARGLGEFLTELRSAVALFLHFSGIDFDNDPEAGEKLDAYIVWVQNVLARYDGALMNLTIGEKGNFLYTCFGAPVMHEDDPWRAASAALELRRPSEQFSYIQTIRVGISQGMMRTGAYGGRTRRTYGALGDDVNLAARLMQAAADRQVLLSETMFKALSGQYQFELLPAIRVKGKANPVPVAALIGRLQQSAASRLFTRPLVGRQAEIQSLLQMILSGMEERRFAGIICLNGDAGVGKSHLIYTLRQQLQGQAERAGGLNWFTCPGERLLGESLHPFKRFLQEYFHQNTGLSQAENQAAFDGVYDRLLLTLESGAAVDLRSVLLRSQFERTRSVLAALVDLHWEGSLYERLEPKLRFENSLAAFKALVLAESLQKPLVLHVEDAHWLDPDSNAMLQALTRGVDGYPFVILLSGRFGSQDHPTLSKVAAGGAAVNMTTLGELSLEEAPQLAGQVLADWQGGSVYPLSSELAGFLYQQTNGNPLFLELLTQDMHERGLLSLKRDVWRLDTQAPASVPASLSAVVIARLDRLDVRVRAAVQTASVLGDEFENSVLYRMQPEEPEMPSLAFEAQRQSIWMLISEVLYLFRQSLLREAAYDMQPQDHLQKLHERAAEVIAQVHGRDLRPYYADLARHYDLAQNLLLAFQYSYMAGDRAVQQYANYQAIQHYQRALRCAVLLENQGVMEEIANERLTTHLALGELLVNTGQYKLAVEQLEQALNLAVQCNQLDSQARACRWMARQHELRSEYAQALEWLQRGLDALQERETTETCEILSYTGLIYSRQGNYARAQEYAERCMQIAVRLVDLKTQARVYNLMGLIQRQCGDSSAAVELFQRALDLYQQTGDISGQATTNNQIANALVGLGRWVQADYHFSQAQRIFEQIGDVFHSASTGSNLGDLALSQGRLDDAESYFQQALDTLEQIGGAPYMLGGIHNNLGAVHLRRCNPQAALRHLEISQGYFDQAKARNWLPELYRHKASAALLSGNLELAEQQANQALTLAREMKMRGEEGLTLRILGEIALERRQFALAGEFLHGSLEILAKNAYEHARCELILSRLLVCQGQAGAARETLEHSIHTLSELGAELDLKEAQQVFAGLVE